MKSETDRQIDELEYQLQDLKSRIAALRRERPREAIGDWRFHHPDGRAVTLAELFGGHDRLVLVHNMGRVCPYCTLWADGFAGLLPHLESRAAFVVSSPDPPEVQRDFARSRGWSFPMVSVHGTDFPAAMGFTDDDGYSPGVSVFVREEGRVYRVGRAEFGPGDDFCPVWHFFDLLPEGIDGWEPRFSYPRRHRAAPPDGATGAVSGVEPAAAREPVPAGEPVAAGAVPGHSCCH